VLKEVKKGFPYWIVDFVSSILNKKVPNREMLREIIQEPKSGSDINSEEVLHANF